MGIYDFYLIREKTIGNATLGTLYNMHTDEEFKTLENKTCIIPPYTYNFKLRQSPKFGLTPWIFDVPDREYILMHCGNKASDSRGCILIGSEVKDDVLLYSRKAFERLMNNLVNGKNYSLRVEYKLW